MTQPTANPLTSAIPKAEPGIDLRSLFTELNFKPHSKAQWEYCESTTRFNVPCCGRRWGKTMAAAHRMTYKSFIPNSYNWIVAPKYALGEKEFRVIFKDYEKLGLLKYCRKNYSVKQGDMRIQTPWNSVIQVVSAEKPDSLLGEGLSHAIMSEAAQHTRNIWEQYIEPALSDLLGTCDFPSTPKGFNWYHGLFALGQDPSHTNYKSWTFPSWTNPTRYPGGINNEEIVRIRATASRSYFDQEYGAKFTSMAGAIYEEWDEQIHVKPHKFNPDWPNFCAFDYGFTNPFVCLDIQIDPGNDSAHVWREYYQRYESTFEHGQRLNQRPNPPGYRMDGAWGDPRGPDQAQTLAIIWGWIASQDVSWYLGVEEIKRMLKPAHDGFPRLTVDPSCVNLIRQMGQLRVKEATRAQQLDLDEMKSDGNIQHKVDDHAADALRYFIGPYYVMGAGTHLEDVYGTNYKGSESEDFLRLHSHSPIVLDDKVLL
jgi:hypothetical protein